VRDDPRLTGASTGEDQQRAIYSFDSGTLLRI
jgi:hypothetical protein